VDKLYFAAHGHHASTVKELATFAADMIGRGQRFEPRQLLTKEEIEYVLAQARNVEALQAADEVARAD
jgi:hypothetical protein